MRSHDRTLLAQLGYNDPDKRDERHDLACRYLATPDVAGRLARLYDRPFAVAPVARTDYEFEGKEGVSHAFVRAAFEWPIEKGEGQYKTTIGFVDLVLGVEQTIAAVGRERRRLAGYSGDWREWQTADQTSRAMMRVGVEVKIGRVSLGDLLRQIKLYRSYADFPAFVAVTQFPYSKQEVEQLANERVRHVRLGPAFDAYCAEQRADTTPGDSMLI